MPPEAREALPMHIALVTDAWAPQVNGVVRTLTETCSRLRRWGYDVSVISPDQYPSLPCPGYPEIRLALATRFGVGRKLDALAPQAVHIATEGPLGVAARRWCLNNGLPFTTAYHTQFPDYVARRTGLSPGWFWPFIRWFHAPSRAVLVSTESVRRQLRGEGINQVRHWGRGVDTASFHPEAVAPALFADLPRPILLHVGRVAIEKNIEDFLTLDHPGSKVVVGDGPQLAELRARFPDAHFLGRQSGAALAGCYAGADVLVFPSRTDTFGLVMIEAMASGTPVAAYPVQGPVDVLSAASGAMNEDLAAAVRAALALDRRRVAAAGRGFSWDESCRQFLDALVPFASERMPAAA